MTSSADPSVTGLRCRMACLACALALACGACAKNPPLPPPEPGLERMVEQPRVDPYTESRFFADGAAMRPTPALTVARDTGIWDLPTATGLIGTAYLQTSPLTLDVNTLRRGQQRYAIACACCHGVRGDGKSAVAQAMSLVTPRDLLSEPYRSYPIGRIFAVEGSGYGVMPGYADMLGVEDRWAVAAYVQVLQVSDHTVLEELAQRRRQDVRKHLP